MSNARVNSLEALQHFSLALHNFRIELMKEVEALELELRRVTGWIQADASQYWQQQLQLGRQQLSENLQQLSRCMSYVRETERRPCTEEKQRVQRAQQRVTLCEAKVGYARAAAQRWEQRLNRLHTQLQRCRDLADSDMRVARNRLEEHLGKLEAYAQLAANTGSPGSVQASAPDSSHGPHPASPSGVDPAAANRLLPPDGSPGES